MSNFFIFFRPGVVHLEHASWFWAWLIAGSVIAFVVYACVITHYMRAAAFAMGYRLEAKAMTWWMKFLFHVAHWRTVILAWIAIIAQLLSYLGPYLLEIQYLPWYGIVDYRTADMITMVCAVLIPLTHASQYANAAETTPVDK